MEAFGYEWGSERELPMRLQEASLACTKGELDTLIDFLLGIREEAAIEGSGHWHYRDWAEGWESRQPDFIIFLSEEEKEGHGPQPGQK